MLTRALSSSLKDFISKDDRHKNVLVIQGARQVGKTFLVDQVLQTFVDRHSSFNLERDRLLRDEIDSSVDFEDFSATMQKYGFHSGQKKILFFDEVQESIKLGEYVRFMKEIWEDSTVILSGSSISKLFAKDTRVPVGRIEYLRVTPLTFEEFADALGKDEILKEAKNKKSKTPPSIHAELIELYDRYLLIGGLPAIVNRYISRSPAAEIDIARKEIYLSQQDDFYRKESKLKPYLFKDGTTAIADLLGSPFALTRITANHREAKATLETLCEWLIAYQCQQRTLSPTSEPRPKVYLYDIGLARQLREGISPQLSLVKTKDPALRTALGGLVENSIFIEMQQGKNFLADIGGWRLSARNPVEVDFVVKSDAATIPVEVKCADKLDKRNLSGLQTYLARTKQKIGILASTAPYEKIVVPEGEIVNLPLYAVSLGEIQAI